MMSETEREKRGGDAVHIGRPRHLQERRAGELGHGRKKGVREGDKERKRKKRMGIGPGVPA